MTLNEQTISQLEFIKNNHFLNTEEIKSIETIIELLKKNIGGIFDKKINKENQIVEYQCVGLPNSIDFKEKLKEHSDRMQLEGQTIEVQYQQYRGFNSALLIGRK